MTVSY